MTVLVGFAAVLLLAGPNAGWLHWIWWALIVATAGAAVARTVIRTRRAVRAQPQVQLPEEARHAGRRAQIWVMSGYALLIAAAVAVGAAMHSVLWGLGAAGAAACLAILAFVPIAMVVSRRQERSGGSHTPLA